MLLLVLFGIGMGYFASLQHLHHRLLKCTRHVQSPLTGRILSVSYHWVLWVVALWVHAGIAVGLAV